MSYPITCPLILNNPFTDLLEHTSTDVMSIEASAILALAFEQHQRNRLAAITAEHRGISLPSDLAELVNEAGGSE